MLIWIEHKLAELHQTGILIADATTGCEKLNIKNVENLDITKKSLTSSQALLREFYAMTLWRSLKTKTELSVVMPKYPAEAMSVYLIDRVHFLSSNDSLFLQMCDILTFIIQRALVHDYLSCVAKEKIDHDKLPFSIDGLNMMKEKISAATYSEEKKDVEFWNITGAEYNLLFDFYLMPSIESMLKDHYFTMQQNE